MALNPPDELQRAWARRVLRLPRDASAEDARRAFLADLKGEPFPSHQAREALRILTDRAAQGPGDLSRAQCRRELDRRLLRALDAFRARYFSLPPAKRRGAYERLRELAGEGEPVASRLRALEPALDLDLEILETLPEHTRRLGRSLALASGSIGNARAQALERAEELLDRRALYEAMVVLQKKTPALVDMVPDFAAMLDVRRALKANPRPRKELAKASGGSSGNLWPLWIAFIVLLNSVRACGTSTPAVRPYQPPPQNQPPSPFRSQRERELYRQFKESLETQKSKPPALPPLEPPPPKLPEHPEFGPRLPAPAPPAEKSSAP